MNTFGIFLLSPFPQLNIKYETLSFGNNVDCLFGKVSIMKQNNNDSTHEEMCLTYCGLQSSLSVYPPFVSVKIRVFVFNCLDNTFLLSANYLVVDKGLVQNSMPESVQAAFASQQQLFIKDRIMLLEYDIQGSKIYQIEVQLTGTLMSAALYCSLCSQGASRDTCRQHPSHPGPRQAVVWILRIQTLHPHLKLRC